MAAAAIADAAIDFSFYFYFTKWHITNGHISGGFYMLVGLGLRRFPRIWGLDRIWGGRLAAEAFACGEEGADSGEEQGNGGWFWGGGTGYRSHGGEYGIGIGDPPGVNSERTEKVPGVKVRV
jgi:hypothetical protein